MVIYPHGYQHVSIRGGQNTSYYGDDLISHSQFIVHPIEPVESQVHTVISNPIFTEQPSISQPQSSVQGMPWDQSQAHFQPNVLPEKLGLPLVTL